MDTAMMHVAVLSRDGSVVPGLSDALARPPGGHGLNCTWRVLRPDSVDDLVALAAEDGRLQAVVVDAALGEESAVALRRLSRLRPEVDRFLVATSGSRTPVGAEDVVVVQQDRAADLSLALWEAVARRARTPFADTLRDYVQGARDAWHTPGHSGGDSLRDSPWVADFHRMMGDTVFHTDLSVSVQSLDSLLEPHSVIQEAQDLAAVAFGAARTFFITNGTSTANKVIMQHLLGAGGKVIVDQACHKSVHHAVILCGAEPVYLPASVNTTYGLYGPVPRQRIFEAIDNHSDAKLLVLTSCTYDGFRYDLAPIIERAHRRGIKVLIDEAWYAHGRFHPALRPTALECGADYVTQSTHKMLSAFSQASMIHVADPDFEEHRFRQHLNMHTSTSPQYAMIASLDVARKQASMEGFAQLSRAMTLARELRAGINATSAFRVLALEDMLPVDVQADGIRLDPLKLSVDTSACARSARQVQLCLIEEHRIQVEKVTHNTLTLLVTPGITDAKVQRLLAALGALAGSTGNSLRTAAPPVPVTLPPMAGFAMAPREAFFSPSTLCELVGYAGDLNAELVGRTSADQVVPYPPGIPVLHPGQEITCEIAEFLLAQCRSDNGIEVHGIVSHRDRPCLRVVAGPAVQVAPGIRRLRA